MIKMKVASVSEMREMDRIAIEKYRIPDAILMENAGGAVSSVVLRYLERENITYDQYGEIGALVFSGSGNNGGDGFVVARKLYSNGMKVKVVFIGKREKLKGAALSNFNILTSIGIDMEIVEPTSSFNGNYELVNKLESDLRNADIIVDAIFGTGLSREVGGFYRELIELINDYKNKLLFSVDIPSGINGDTGNVMGVAVKANATVTFGLPKRGNILYPGYEYCGDLYVTHISFPKEIYRDNSVKVEINDPAVIPKRKSYGHKGDFGDVLFIAGARKYYGAPFFSAMSFLKAGGGYARLASPESVTRVVANRGSEIVMVPLEETSEGSIALKNIDLLVDIAEKVDMVVIGPGISLNEETGRLFFEFVKRTEKPLIVDGDGLTFLSMKREVLYDIKAPLVLTPHPGEMARIMNKPVNDVVSDAIGTIDAFFSSFLRPFLMPFERDVVVVLKGAHSIIGSLNIGEKAGMNGTANISINLTGNSGMATAGSGDVLTGTIAAMYGLGLGVVDAVKAGVYVHGLAGDIAAENLGEDGVLAGDILNCLPEAVKKYRSKGYRVSFEKPKIQVV